MRDIVGNLPNFARLDEAEFKEAALNAALGSAVEIARHELKKKAIRLETSFQELPPVLCHPGKINQVSLNLLMNAVQACQPGGMIALRTRAAPAEAITVASGGSRVALDGGIRQEDPRWRNRASIPFW